MNFACKFLSVSFLLLLAACSAKISSAGDEVGSFGDGRVLKGSDAPLSGTVDGKNWRASKAVARYIAGEYNVTIAQQGVEISCQNSMPNSPHVAFVVPNGPGRYSYDGTTGGRLVNFNFPYSLPNGGGSDNVLSSKSMIIIDNSRNGIMSGSVSALSPLAETSHQYEIAGRFEAQICDGPAGPLSVTSKTSAGFNVLYSEAVAQSDGYELRFMNKVPNRKCQRWSAWMMDETPIKYVTLRVPAKVGQVTVAKDVVEFGSQDKSSGWSTAYFNGSLELTSIANATIGYSVSVKSQISDDITIVGQGTINVCN